MGVPGSCWPGCSRSVSSWGGEAACGGYVEAPTNCGTSAGEPKLPAPLAVLPLWAGALGAAYLGAAAGTRICNRKLSAYWIWACSSDTSGRGLSCTPQFCRHRSTVARRAICKSLQPKQAPPAQSHRRCCAPQPWPPPAGCPHRRHLRRCCRWRRPACPLRAWRSGRWLVGGPQLLQRRRARLQLRQLRYLRWRCPILALRACWATCNGGPSIEQTPTGEPCRTAGMAAHAFASNPQQRAQSGPAGAPLGLLGDELGGDGAHGAQVGAQPLAGLPSRRRPLRQPLLWSSKGEQ
jgi:hypothetical protein